MTGTTCVPAIDSIGSLAVYSSPIPGGWVKAREDPDIAIRREVTEHTGLAVDVVAVVAVDATVRVGPTSDTTG